MRVAHTVRHGSYRCRAATDLYVAAAARPGVTEVHVDLVGMDQSAYDPPSTLDALPSDGPPDRTVRLLADPVRRRLVGLLDDLDTAERLGALTRTLAALDDDVVPDDARRLRIELYHVHVPKLVESGVAEFDEEDRAVALTDRGAELADLLE